MRFIPADVGIFFSSFFHINLVPARWHWLVLIFPFFLTTRSPKQHQTLTSYQHPTTNIPLTESRSFPCPPTLHGSTSFNIPLFWFFSFLPNRLINYYFYILSSRLSAPVDQSHNLPRREFRQFSRPLPYLPSRWGCLPGLRHASKSPVISASTALARAHCIIFLIHQRLKGL